MNPAEATTNRRAYLYMSTLRDQYYFGRGALLDIGFADSRGIARESPQGRVPLPDHARPAIAGTTFSAWIATSTGSSGSPTCFCRARHLLGTHRLKFGVDFEREAFHQKTDRHDYQVLRDDNTVARHVTFEGSPFQERKNLEGAHYLQDAWTPRDGIVIEAGLRVEWNEIVRDLQFAPRLAAAWSPKRLRDTKFSAGWGIYYDAIPLNTHRAQPGPGQLLDLLSCPDSPPTGPFLTWFFVDDALLRVPYYQQLQRQRRAQAAARSSTCKSGYMRRSGNRGFTFVPTGSADASELTYALTNPAPRAL